MFSIDSMAELLAMHRALLELHWVVRPNDPAIIGSKLVADIANRILDEIIQIEYAHNRVSRAEEWKLWRQLTPDRIEFARLKERLAAYQQWDSPDDQRILIRCLASPFVLSDNLVDALIGGTNGDATL